MRNLESSDASEKLAIDGLLTESDFDDIAEMDPYDGNPPSRRSDRELERLLRTLDSLPKPASERGNG